MPEARYTLPGTKLPEEALPPTLLFHRWHAYDRFEPEPDLDKKTGNQKRDSRTKEPQWLDPFSQNEAKLPFLRKVAETVQRLGPRYKDWYQRFADACKEVGAESPVPATTLWRLAAGWGTNPAFETGLTLDHLLGFPFIPGSAVKGLLHRVAEQELLESRDGAPALPPAPEALPGEPPEDLLNALSRCRRVRALFGSLHLRRGKEGGPEAPYDRLAGWRGLLPEPGKEPPSWTETRRHLARLCSDAPAGGMVACFDAVPDPKTFTGKRDVLTPDVLNPHPLTTKEKGPIPIHFLAVRDDVTFELRYRLAAWPASDPRDHRDEEERERAADLGGVDRKTVAADLKRWLVRGLAELGLGGKTSAGYGYLLAEGARLPMPKLLEEEPVPAEPEEPISEAERFARSVLPDEMDSNRAVDALDKVLTMKEPNLTVQITVIARFNQLFPGAVEKWRTKKSPATMRRVAAIDRVLGGSQENEP